MVIDSSALIVLLLNEPEMTDFAAAIDTVADRWLSAASYLESALVARTRLGAEGQRLLDRLVTELNLEIVPFTREQAILAIAAHRRFGKGSRHPAALNFGDCFTYALAKFMNAPLLFKGNDFSRTDLIPAVPATAP